MSRHCAEFFAHWKSLPCSHGIPHTRAFLDSATPLMRGALILEVMPEGTLVRLMGSTLVARWQDDFTGAHLETRIALENRSRFRRDVECVCRHPAGARAIGETRTELRRTVDYEMVLLPIAVDDGKPPRCVAFRINLDELDYRDRKVEFPWPPKLTWIDIGAGEPE
ncbi:MAG: PAS domain-containing protein [Rhodospirillaceae bacterium]